MDIEKLIEAVRLCGSTPKVDQCKQCAYWSGGDTSKCIPRMTTDAATVLSALQAENEKLWAELEQVREYAREATVTMNNLYGACGQFCDDTIWSFRQRWRGIRED